MASHPNYIDADEDYFVSGDEEEAHSGSENNYFAAGYYASSSDPADDDEDVDVDDVDVHVHVDGDDYDDDDDDDEMEMEMEMDGGEGEQVEEISGALGFRNEAEFDRSNSPDCPICFKPWTAEGPHRVCCFPCGHVHGRSCLESWLQLCGETNGRCPQCSRKFRQREIINLYAPLNLIPGDSLDKVAHMQNEVAELRNMMNEVAPLRCEVAELKSEIAEMRSEMVDVAELQHEVTRLKSKMAQMRSEMIDMCDLLGEVDELKTKMADMRSDMTEMRRIQDGMQIAMRKYPTNANSGASGSVR